MRFIPFNDYSSLDPQPKQHISSPNIGQADVPFGNLFSQPSQHGEGQFNALAFFGGYINKAPVKNKPIIKDIKTFFLFIINKFKVEQIIKPILMAIKILVRLFYNF